MSFHKDTFHQSRKKLIHIDDIDLDDYDDINSRFDVHGEMDSGVDTCLICGKSFDSSGEDDRRYHLAEECPKIDRRNPKITYCERMGCRIDTREAEKTKDGYWKCDVCDTSSGIKA